MVVPSPAGPAGLHAARVFLNGRVFTADAAGSSAAALAVDGDRIAAVGSAAEVRAAVSPDAEVVDLGGRTVVPGFVDAHNHFACTAETFFAVDAKPASANSIADLRLLVDHAAERTPPGGWIRGFGMDWTKFAEGRRPTRWDLDEVTRVHPVVILHVSGHYALVNSKALADRGIGDDTLDPPGGSFERDAAGRPTGLLLDAATNLVLQSSVDIRGHGPNIHTAIETAALVGMLEEGARRYLAAGLTTICDPQVTSRELTAYRAARARGVLRIRTVAMPLSHQLEELLEIGLVGPFGDDWLRIGGMKFYTDGAVTGGTAVFSEPMGRQGQYPGTLYHQPAELAALLRRAAAAGWQLAIHTMGDRALGIMLDGVEAADAASPNPGGDNRHRIEHCTYPTPAQLGRMARLGMVPITQPGSIAELGDIWLDHLGDRIRRATPLRSMLDAGIRPAISSDAFVQSYRPLDTIAAAMLRVTPNGVHVGADQELTIGEAIRAHTIDAARAVHLDDRIGSIEPGKLADLAVIDGDLLGASAETVRTLPIWMTVVGGEIAFGAPQLANQAANAGASA